MSYLGVDDVVKIRLMGSESMEIPELGKPLRLIKMSQATTDDLQDLLKEIEAGKKKRSEGAIFYLANGCCHDDGSAKLLGRETAVQLAGVLPLMTVKNIILKLQAICFREPSEGNP